MPVLLAILAVLVVAYFLEPKNRIGKKLMDGMSNYVFLPSGMIQGGTMSYSADPLTGLINYSVAVKISKWFLSTTETKSGSCTVDPKLLSPSSLSVGYSMTIDGVTSKVVSMSNGTACLSLSGKATGSAVVSTIGPVIELVSLDANATVMGMSIQLGLRPA